MLPLNNKGINEMNELDCLRQIVARAVAAGFDPHSPGPIGDQTPGPITGTTITATVKLVVTSIQPGGDLIVTQNSVAAITSQESNAQVNTLSIANGCVAMGVAESGATNRLLVSAISGGAALRLTTVSDNDLLISVGGTGTISFDAPGIAGGRWAMLVNGEFAYGVTTPATGVRTTVQGLASVANDIQRWTAYTGTGTAGATLASISGAGLLMATGVTVASGSALKLGNSAVTGLVAGAVAALTTATIVIVDASGQAYRVPCVI